MMTFDKALQKALENCPYTALEISKKLTITKSYFYNLKNGKEFPSQKMIKKFMELLKFPHEYNPDIDLLIHDIVPLWISKKLRNDPTFRSSIINILNQYHVVDKPNGSFVNYYIINKT